MINLENRIHFVLGTSFLKLVERISHDTAIKLVQVLEQNFSVTQMMMVSQ